MFISCISENTYNTVFRYDYFICCILGMFKYYNESRILIFMATIFSAIDLIDNELRYNIARFLVNGVIAILTIFIIKVHRIIDSYDANSLIFIIISNLILLSFLLLTFENYELILMWIILFTHINIFVHIFALNIDTYYI